MNLFFIENINNFLGKSLINFFSDDKKNSIFLYSKDYEPKKNFFENNFSENNFSENNFHFCEQLNLKKFRKFKKIENFENIKTLKNYCEFNQNLKDENIFVFNTDFSDEYSEFSENSIEKIYCKLNEIFEITNNLCARMAENRQKASFYFITLNQTVHNCLDAPSSPIYNEAINSFIKSIAKETTSFDLFFYGICIDPIFEMLDQKQIKSYKNNMNLYSSRKIPTKTDDLLKLLNNFFENRTKLLSGHIFNVGDGMFF